MLVLRCECVRVCVDRVRQGRNEGESVMKATDERAGESECVSGPTLSQCFSGVSQDAIWGVATERVPVPWVLPVGSVLAGRVEGLGVLGRVR